MAVNNNAVFPDSGNIDWINSMTAANTNADITAGTSYLVFTAGADGSNVREIRLKAAPGNNTAATVLRIWINNGSTTGTAANSVLFGEMSIPATVASSSAAQPDFVYPMNIDLDANFKIYLTLGTAPGGSGAFSACAVAKDY